MAIKIIVTIKIIETIMIPTIDRFTNNGQIHTLKQRWGRGRGGEEDGVEGEREERSRRILRRRRKLREWKVRKGREKGAGVIGS